MFLTLAVWYVTFLAIVFVAVCLLLNLVILIQRPKGGGLAGAFGGAGGGAQAFGGKTGDFLTWFTVGLFVLFLLLAMVLTWTIQPAPAGPAVATPGQQVPVEPGAGAGTDGEAETPAEGEMPTTTPTGVIGEESAMPRGVPLPTTETSAPETDAPGETVPATEAAGTEPAAADATTPGNEAPDDAQP